MFNSFLAVGVILLGQVPTFPAKTNYQTGIASYYSNYYDGRRMANGEIFRNNSNSCAHRTRAFGTTLTITNLATGESTTCVVRDRGPFVDGRVVDLSQRTFREIAPLSQGLVNVEVK